MQDRPNWHYDHPPACTCVLCSRSRAGGRQVKRVGRQRPGHTSRTSGGNRRGNGRLILALLILVAVIAGLGAVACQEMLPFEIQLATRQPAGDNAPPVAPVLYVPTETPVPATATAQSMIMTKGAAKTLVSTGATAPTALPASPPAPTSVPNVGPPPTPDHTATLSPPPTPAPTSQATISKTVPILAEVTTVSFVEIGYTLNLRVDDIPDCENHEQVKLVVTHRDGTEQEEITQFLRIRNGDYIGAVTVERERIENPDPEWVRDNITVEVLPERVFDSSQAASQSQEVMRTPILSPTNTPRPTSIPKPTPMPTFHPSDQAPALRHGDEKRYMLELINAERKKAGVPPVVLGDNGAAQLHAERPWKTASRAIGALMA